MDKLIKIPMVATPPYDTLIKEEKANYRDLHRKFINEQVNRLTESGYSTAEIAKIIGRSESYVLLQQKGK